MAVILMSYAKLKGYDVSAAADLKKFTDSKSISAWAKAAMQWANAGSLISGIGASTLAPQGAATRAQVAAILMRFVENIAQ